MKNKSATYYQESLIKDLSVTHDITIKEAQKAIHFIIKTLITNLCKGHLIKISNFGKLFNSTRKPKSTTHPITQERHTIPKRKTISCKFSKSLFFNL